MFKTSAIFLQERYFHYRVRYS